MTETLEELEMNEAHRSPSEQWSGEDVRALLDRSSRLVRLNRTEKIELEREQLAGLVSLKGLIPSAVLNQHEAIEDTPSGKRIVRTLLQLQELVDELERSEQVAKVLREDEVSEGSEDADDAVEETPLQTKEEASDPVDVEPTSDDTVQGDGSEKVVPLRPIEEAAEPVGAEPTPDETVQGDGSENVVPFRPIEGQVSVELTPERVRARYERLDQMLGEMKERHTAARTALLQRSPTPLSLWGQAEKLSTDIDQATGELLHPRMLLNTLLAGGEEDAELLGSLNEKLEKTEQRFQPLLAANEQFQAAIRQLGIESPVKTSGEGSEVLEEPVTQSEPTHEELTVQDDAPDETAEVVVAANDTERPNVEHDPSTNAELAASVEHIGETLKEIEETQEPLYTFGALAGQEVLEGGAFREQWEQVNTAMSEVRNLLKEAERAVAQLLDPTIDPDAVEVLRSQIDERLHAATEKANEAKRMQGELEKTVLESSESPVNEPGLATAMAPEAVDEQPTPIEANIQPPEEQPAAAAEVASREEIDERQRVFMNSLEESLLSEGAFDPDGLVRYLRSYGAGIMRDDGSEILSDKLADEVLAVLAKKEGPESLGHKELSALIKRIQDADAFMKDALATSANAEVETAPRKFVQPNAANDNEAQAVAEQPLEEEDDVDSLIGFDRGAMPDERTRYGQEVPQVETDESAVIETGDADAAHGAEEESEKVSAEPEVIETPEARTSGEQVDPQYRQAIDEARTAYLAAVEKAFQEKKPSKWGDRVKRLFKSQDQSLSEEAGVKYQEYLGAIKEYRKQVDDRLDAKSQDRLRVWTDRFKQLGEGKGETGYREMRRRALLRGIGEEELKRIDALPAGDARVDALTDIYALQTRERFHDRVDGNLYSRSIIQELKAQQEGMQHIREKQWGPPKRQVAQKLSAFFGNKHVRRGFQVSSLALAAYAGAGQLVGRGIQMATGVSVGAAAGAGADRAVGALERRSLGGKRQEARAAFRAKRVEIDQAMDQARSIDVSEKRWKVGRQVAKVGVGGTVAYVVAGNIDEWLPDLSVPGSQVVVTAMPEAAGAAGEVAEQRVVVQLEPGMEGLEGAAATVAPEHDLVFDVEKQDNVWDLVKERIVPQYEFDDLQERIFLDTIDDHLQAAPQEELAAMGFTPGPDGVYDANLIRPGDHLDLSVLRENGVIDRAVEAAGGEALDLDALREMLREHIEAAAPDAEVVIAPEAEAPPADPTLIAESEEQPGVEPVEEPAEKNSLAHAGALAGAVVAGAASLLGKKNEASSRNAMENGQKAANAPSGSLMYQMPMNAAQLSQIDAMTPAQREALKKLGKEPLAQADAEGASKAASVPGSEVVAPSIAGEELRDVKAQHAEALKKRDEAARRLEQFRKENAGDDEVDPVTGEGSAIEALASALRLGEQQTSEVKEEVQPKPSEPNAEEPKPLKLLSGETVMMKPTDLEAMNKAVQLIGEQLLNGDTLGDAAKELAMRASNDPAWSAPKVLFALFKRNESMGSYSRVEKLPDGIPADHPFVDEKNADAVKQLHDMMTRVVERTGVPYGKLKKFATLMPPETAAAVTVRDFLEQIAVMTIVKSADKTPKKK